MIPTAETLLSSGTYDDALAGKAIVKYGDDVQVGTRTDKSGKPMMWDYLYVREPQKPAKELYKDAIEMIQRGAYNPEHKDYARVHEDMEYIQGQLVERLKIKMREEPDFEEKLKEEFQKDPAERVKQLEGELNLEGVKAGLVAMAGKELDPAKKGKLLEEASKLNIGAIEVFQNMALMFQEANIKQDMIILLNMELLNRVNRLERVAEEQLEQMKQMNENIAKMVAMMDKQVNGPSRAKQNRWFGWILNPAEYYIGGPAGEVKGALDTYNNVCTAMKVVRTVASFGWVLTLV